eukprot:CAMPEP_0171658900 /NCGR_PEP_ID=MMETSP0990-20121206/43251_1 /TAXON_ID=483369 /ORGANISM="non described non described, Strain CCMP2098" /LENGTH=40 /DNA_ID= /DNA_START= /DNA_END= /DNA_ORIENTATION=
MTRIADATSSNTSPCTSLNKLRAEALAVPSARKRVLSKDW